MRVSNRNRLGAMTLAMVAVASGAAAQTISIADTQGRRGGTVPVAVRLSAPTAMTAALLRVEYDPTVLENPAVMPGPMLWPNHAIDSHAPVAGRFNVAVYPTTRMPGFAALQGTLFTLLFDVKIDAPLGASPVKVTTAGTPGLPASDLTDTAGAVVAHTTTDGSVRLSLAARGSWMLYE